MKRLFSLLLLCLLATAVSAGDLTRADLEQRFLPPLHVGNQLKDVPAWPITSELEPEAGPIGWVFESIDLAPIPGFEGTPMNLLIALDRKGSFMDVVVLRQHEPVFLSGLGPAPLHDFVRQYAGKNLRQEINVASTYGDTRGGANRVVLDGVAKATASVRIVNQTVLAAALEVARARLGFADARKKGPVARARDDRYEVLDFPQLLARGYVTRVQLSNRQVEKLFAGTDGAGVDEVALSRPDDTFIDLYIGYVNAPSIGRALLGEAGYRRLQGKVEDGQQAYWIASAGRYPIVDDNFVPGTQPPRLTLAQNGLPVEMRDLVFDLPAPPAGAPRLDVARVFRVDGHAGLDPGRALDLSITITRAKGQILPLLTHADAKLEYAPSAALFEYPPTPLPEWLIAWQGRLPDLAVISLALALLSLALARPRWIARDARRLALFRNIYLAYTLVFLGWYAQGQLSIVHLTGAAKALAAHQGLGSFLYDPVCLLLIAYTVVSFFVWGRGTFCGWLCPFGALQEFVGVAARHLKLPQLQLPARLAWALDRSRYLLLAALLAAAVMAPQTAERWVEVEPFKTAITTGFDRTWPYLAYCAALLTLGALYYKFFCRFLCPLGAAITLGGKLRSWKWLARRAECGQPCQTCRTRCHYGAIEKSGAIRYDDCFQCLDCVGIYHDEQRCAPILLYRRKGKVVVPHAAPSHGTA
ncbi:MAG: 4Fe-4S binding protein [Rhodocyclaceae bacterium]|nr:4Fe-4S binding protein [Rhodocyclaceae bacterium]MBX3670273.1 4Fe-4S binding protein [Rhodocyclaceae bacterium]